MNILGKMHFNFWDIRERWKANIIEPGQTVRIFFWLGYILVTKPADVLKFKIRNNHLSLSWC